MTKDTSWISLFKPGEADNFFDTHELIPLQINSDCFSLSNALFLAEISRLIYRPKFFSDNHTTTHSFKYELLNYIENTETSTHVAVIKIIQKQPCIVIAFRGTDESEDWGINLRVYQSDFYSKGKVHRGFKKAYLSVKESLLETLRDNTLPLFITGHSLGAALAILATSDLQERPDFDSCYTFGSPRIGDKDFLNAINCQSIFRVINNSDIVTTVPIDFATIQYQHIGQAFLIDEAGQLCEGLSDDEIFEYQKSKLDGLKNYALSKILNNKLDTIKDDLPSYLADHAPINYVSVIGALLNRN